MEVMSLTNKEIIKIAMEQSAIDINCSFEDFIAYENKVVISKDNDKARRYLKLPFLCYLTSYSNNIVASVSEPFAESANKYINKFSVEHCFETPNLHWFINKIKTHNANVCFMAECFLPNHR